MAGKKKLESVFWCCIKDRCEWFLHLSVGGSAGALSIRRVSTEEYGSGRREGGTPLDALPGPVRRLFFFNRKDDRVISAIQTQKLCFDFL